MYLVNGMTADVIFYSCTTRSFLSLMLSEKFGDTLRSSDYPFEVEIADERTMIALSVY